MAVQNNSNRGKYIVIAVLLALLLIWVGNSVIGGADTEKSNADALPAEGTG